MKASIRQLSFFWVLLIAATSLLLLAGLISVKSASADQTTDKNGEKLLTVYDRGAERVFLTSAGTVGEALELAGIKLSTADAVEPNEDSELIASNYSVNIYRAKPVIVVDGAWRQKIMTSRQTPKQIAEDAGITLHEEDLTELTRPEDILSAGAGMEMQIDRATLVKMILYGKPTEVRTQAATVGELLEEKNIKLETNDQLSVDFSQPITAGLEVELWRDGTKTITQEEAVPFTVEKIQDADRPAGYREVQTVGEAGNRTVTYEINMKNRQEVGRKEIASVTTKEPKKQIEIIGMKFNYTGGPLSEAQINALGTCESGMTPTRNSGNGFYGAFQFMPATWRNAAPAEYKGVMPHEAPLEAQKQAVQNLLSRSSIYTQFPGCAKKMSAQGIL